VREGWIGRISGGFGKLTRKYVARSNGGMISMERVMHWDGFDHIVVVQP
jgi:hypothetical protein